MDRMIRNAFSLLLATALLTSPAWADGWSDLQSALQRLQGKDFISAELKTEVWNITGKGDDQLETHAQAAITISENESGFQVLYGKPLLSQMDEEQKTAAEDPNNQTPTLNAVAALSPTDLRPMLSAATELRRQLDEAEFISEAKVGYNGTPARLLTFEKSLSSLPEKERQYMKEFESIIKVWTTEDGTPLASQSQMQVKGRFMVVIKFEFAEAAESVYRTVGDRLVVVRRESKSNSSGAGEAEDTRTVKELNIL